MKWRFSLPGNHLFATPCFICRCQALKHVCNIHLIPLKITIPADGFDKKAFGIIIIGCWVISFKPVCSSMYRADKSVCFNLCIFDISRLLTFSYQYNFHIIYDWNLLWYVSRKALFFVLVTLLLECIFFHYPNGLCILSFLRFGCMWAKSAD